MARVVPATVTNQLLRQRGPLRSYQWLWLLLCVVAALAVGAPRVVSQPIIYTAEASAQVDIGRSYASLVTTPTNAPNYAAMRGEFDAVATIATTLLLTKEANGTPVYRQLGSPTLNVGFAPHADGRIAVAATAPSAEEAQRLANDAAEAFARSLRAAGGREIFRSLVGWEIYAASTGVPPRDQFQSDVRQIWVRGAFNLNKAFDIIEQPRTVDMLTPEDQSDLARALEVREQELSKVDLVGIRGRIDDPATPVAQREQLRRDELRLGRGLVSIRDALSMLYTTYGVAFRPDAASAVYRSQLAASGTIVDRQIPLFLLLTVMAGLGFGGFGVAVDRSAGVMAKLRDLWNYRELIRNLVLRDLRVRYKGSAFGYLWTQLAPLLLMLVFLFVFSTLQRQPIALFPIFLIVGLLPWNFCSEAIVSGSRSIIDNANLIKKVYFPREILPLVSVFSALVNYLLSLPMMFLVMAVAQLLYAPLREQGLLLHFSWTMLYLPVLVMIQALFLTGVVFFTSALSVSFRDFVHLIGILVQFWFFLTPVVYALENLRLSPGQEQLLRWLNPMASLIEFYREILYGGIEYLGGIPQTAIPAADAVFRVLLTSVVVLTFGYWFFQRRSRTFGEAI